MYIAMKAYMDMWDIRWISSKLSPIFIRLSMLMLDSACKSSDYISHVRSKQSRAKHILIEPHFHTYERVTKRDWYPCVSTQFIPSMSADKFGPIDPDENRLFGGKGPLSLGPCRFLCMLLPTWKFCSGEPFNLSEAKVIVPRAMQHASATVCWSRVNSVGLACEHHDA